MDFMLDKELIIEQVFDHILLAHMVKVLLFLLVNLGI
jgi:hypothetical protein